MLLFDLLAQGSSQGQGNWWEPGTENFLDVGDLAAILAFLTALVMTTMGVTRWWLRQLKGIIRDEIEKATEPIHPNSNGGYSLPDVAKRQRILEKKVNDLGNDMVETKDLLLQIAVNTQKPTVRRSRKTASPAKKTSAPRKKTQTKQTKKTSS